MWTGLFLGEYLLMHGDLDEAEEKLVSFFPRRPERGPNSAGGLPFVVGDGGAPLSRHKVGPFHGSPGRGCK